VEKCTAINQSVNTFPFTARRKLAVFSQRNGLRKFLEEKKLYAGKTYPHLWISFVVQTTRVLIDIIHSTINRCATLIANFFYSCDEFLS
jgi:hypothetical protein